MGRGRKPLALQKGNLTKKQKIEKEQEESLVKGDTDSIRGIVRKMRIYNVKSGNV